MTYAVVVQSFPLGEVDAPNIVAAIRKGELMAEQQEVQFHEVDAVPVAAEED